MTTPADPSHSVEALLRHADWVRRLAHRLARGADADDALQDAWTDALRDPPSGPENARGFLATLLRNRLRMRARTERRRAAREARSATNDIGRTAEDPHEVVARAEIHRVLVKHVLDLSEPDRSVILLHYFEGQSVSAIANALASSNDAVRARLRRARAQLRARMDQAYGNRRAWAVVPTPSSAAAWCAALPAPLALMTSTKLIGAAVAAVAATATLWLWNSDPTPPERTTAVRRSAPPATGAVPDANDSVDASFAQPERVVMDDSADRSPLDGWLTGRLVGLDPNAPWTTRVHVDLSGVHDDRGHKIEPRLQVAADGTFACRLPDWVAPAKRIRLQIITEDPLYLPTTHRDKERDFLGGEVAIEVRACAILKGRVVDGRGKPVVGARVTAFQMIGHAPHREPLQSTNTSQKGTFHLRVPFDGDVLVTAVPMEPMQLSGRLLTGRYGAIADVGQPYHHLAPRARPHTAEIARTDELPDFVLPDTDHIQGTMLWQDGSPVTNARASAWADFGTTTLDVAAPGTRLRWSPNGDVILERARAEIDASGNFDLRVPRGVRHWITAQDFEGCAFPYPIQSFGRHSTAPGRVMLTVPGKAVTVTLTANGHPIPAPRSISARIEGGAWEVSALKLDESAQFRVVLLNDRDRILSVTAEGYRARTMPLKARAIAARLEVPLESIDRGSGR